MIDILVVGDIHAEPHDLEDCERLLDLTHRTAEERAVDAILYLGDQNNNHDTTSVTVLAFYRRRFAALRRWKQFAIKGNHDQSDPTKSFPHAMSAYEDLVTVIDKPTIIAPGVGALPYYFDAAELVREENALSERLPPLNYLYCHATILGARYDNGFFAKDAIDVSLLKTPKIGCGHIHTPQKVGDRVTYFGSPRWRTLGDASVKKRGIWIVRHSDTGSVVSMSVVSTIGTCRRILRLEDRPDAPMQHPEHGDIDRLHVKIYGTPARIKERTELFKAQYKHVSIQGVPERVRAPEVRESEGVVKGFERFADAFVPPHGSVPGAVRQLVRDKVVWA